jgi:hypothetical protein
MTSPGQDSNPVVVGAAIFLTCFTAVLIPSLNLSVWNYLLVVSIGPVCALLWVVRHYMAPVLLGSNVLLLGGLIATRVNGHSAIMVACQLVLGVLMVVGGREATPMKWYDYQNAMKPPQAALGVFQASLGLVSLFETPYGTGQLLATTLACWYVVMAGWNTARIDSGLVAIGGLVAGFVIVKGLAPKGWALSQVILVSCIWTRHWVKAHLDRDKELPGPEGVSPQIIRNLQKYTAEFHRDWGDWEYDLISVVGQTHREIYLSVRKTSITGWSNLPLKCGATRELFKAETDRRIVDIITSRCPEGCQKLVREYIAPTYLKSRPKHEIIMIPERAAGYQEWSQGTPGLITDWVVLYNILTRESQSRNPTVRFGFMGLLVLKSLLKGRFDYEMWCFNRYDRLGMDSMQALVGWAKSRMGKEAGLCYKGSEVPFSIQRLLREPVPSSRSSVEFTLDILRSLGQVNQEGVPDQQGPVVTESGASALITNRWHVIKLLS